MNKNQINVAVVIPAFKVSRFILPLIKNIPSDLSSIIVVDDACPENSGALVENEFLNDPRVKVVFHEHNQGVGGAVVTGYREALRQGVDIVVKLDGDGQMRPEFIFILIDSIIKERADYAKGNRFFRIESLKKMPYIRLFGNAILSFASKLTHGYWNIMDPTNGFTAIHTSVLSLIPLEKLDEGYFFESDMLFRLGVLRAVVQDVPMDASYGDEESSLSISKVVLEFPAKFLVRFTKRIFYNYFLRGFNPCSFELVFGFIFLVAGVSYGLIHWFISHSSGVPASAGTVMLSAFPTAIGLNLLIAALTYDVSNIPREPLQLYIPKKGFFYDA